jgi:O-antigen/teichoic acid export membrane protein
MPKLQTINASDDLTGGRLLARNSIFNLLGEIVPFAAAVVAIPFLIKALGTDRFGVLSLVWIAIGYFSFFDLGLGRALTKFVSENLGSGQVEVIPEIVWTSLFLLLALGMAGTFAVSLLARWMVYSALNIPVSLQPETLRSFYILALSLPFVVITAGLRGVLQAQQRFGLLNVVRVPMGLAAYLGPLLVLPFSHSLLPVVEVLATNRLIFAGIHLLLCFHVIPALKHRVILNFSIVPGLLRFGGWITVSNIVSPAMLYLDRFIVSALLSTAAVAYYATPYSAVTALLLIPTGIVAVLFPAFATSFVQDPGRAGRLCAQGVKVVLLAMFPITLLIVAFARPGLTLWLGAEFSQHGFRVLQVLAIGILVNSLAFMPFALIQGAGRPDLTAKLHLFELPIYLPAVWGMTRRFGIEGTAIAWTARVTVDALLLFIIARWLLPQGTFRLKHLEVPIALALSVLAFSMIPKGVVSTAATLVFIMVLFLYAAWFMILDSQERVLVQTLFSNRDFIRRWRSVE